MTATTKTYSYTRDGVWTVAARCPLCGCEITFKYHGRLQKWLPMSEACVHYSSIYYEGGRLLVVWDVTPERIMS